MKDSIPDFKNLVERAIQTRWNKVSGIDLLSIPFRSEHDFQFCLASELEKEYNNAVVLLEYSVGAFRHRADIVVVLGEKPNEKKYIIELKYNVIDNKGRYIAGSSYLVDDKYKQDIDLVEKILNNKKNNTFLIDRTEAKFEKGYCIFLTNNKTLCEKLEVVSNNSTEIKLENFNEPHFRLYLKEVLR